MVEYSAGEHEGELEGEIHVFREGSLVEIKGVASSVAGEQRGVAPLGCKDKTFKYARSESIRFHGSVL